MPPDVVNSLRRNVAIYTPALIAEAQEVRSSLQLRSDLSQHEMIEAFLEYLSKSGSYGDAETIFTSLQATAINISETRPLFIYLFSPSIT